MSFYSYKNANPNCCPGTISGSALDGLQEKVCVQVKRVYDSAMTQEQLTKQTVTITSYAQVNNTCTCNACGCQETQETIPPTSAPVPPITFESCRSTTTEGNIRNLTVDRLCDRPCFARVRATIDIPIDILFVDSRCVEYIGKATISVNRDVLLSIPDESIVPYTLESMVSAICVSGTYLGNNQFKMTIGVSAISLRRYMPNPAGLIDIDERSAPSEVKAPPIPITRAVPNGCDRESAAKSVDIIRSLLYVSPPNSRFWACNGAAATQAASNIMILRFIHYLCFIVD